VLGGEKVRRKSTLVQEDRKKDRETVRGGNERWGGRKGGGGELRVTTAGTTMERGGGRLEKDRREVRGTGKARGIAKGVAAGGKDVGSEGVNRRKRGVCRGGGGG